jgi:hypothetical protein
MSTDRDRFEPTEADLEAAANQRFDRPQDERKISDREVELPQAHAQPVDTSSAEGETEDRTALFEPSKLNDFKTRWTDVQTSFVDEPRSAVRQADALVSDVIQGIADSFGNERRQLEQQWDRGGDVSTEDLRLALQRYRTFFSRLLTL